MNKIYCATLLACLPFGSSGQQLSVYEYRGFRVDFSEAQNNPAKESLRAAMNKQIDMVLAVELPPRILDFFRRVPLRMRQGEESFAGHYTGKGHKIVELTTQFLANGHKPALLHEFLHAYHDQVLPGGFQNKSILAYFNRARSLNAYDSHSHMMANPKEYFASAATAYLFGVTQLEPFTREKVQKSQPYFHKYLQSLFGPNAGSYNGSIEK